MGRQATRGAISAHHRSHSRQQSPPSRLLATPLLPFPAPDERSRAEQVSRLNGEIDRLRASMSSLSGSKVQQQNAQRAFDEAKQKMDEFSETFAPKSEELKRAIKVSRLPRLVLPLILFFCC